MGVNRVKQYLPSDEVPPARVLTDVGEEASAEVRVLSQMTGLMELIAHRLTAIEAKVDDLARQLEDT